MTRFSVDKTFSEICRLHGGNVEFDHPMSAHSTVSIGGKVRAWFTPHTTTALAEAMEFTSENGIRIVVIGAGSNVLVRDEGLDAIAVNLGQGDLSGLEFNGRVLTAGAGAFLARAIAESAKLGLSGLEGLVSIPATVGGALAMNASYKCEISDRLREMLVMDFDGGTEWIKKENLDFGYRFSTAGGGRIILKAVFDLETLPAGDIAAKIKEYQAHKLKTQPLEKKTLGCVFKNPSSGMSSGELIDKSGLKGLKRGAAQVSEKHANFIVNTGGASSADYIGLLEEVREKVFEKFNVRLETEIEIL